MPTLRNVNTNKIIEVSAAEAKELVGRRWVQVDDKAKKAAPKKAGLSATVSVAEPRDPDRPKPAADNDTGRGEDAAVDSEAHL